LRGLVVGRFQPFHKGHLAVIKEVLGECADLIVVIGSAEDSHTEKNPFTAGERYQMIIASLTGDELARTHIIPVRDVNRYSVWVNHVESYVPPFDVVYSNSDLTRSLFSQAGYEVRKTKAYSLESFSGTEIRRRIVSGESWDNLVPKPVAMFLDSLDAKKRLMDGGARPSKTKRGGGRAR
jgi:nicotinamide-nucleotide adenylyltransferase